MLACPPVVTVVGKSDVAVLSLSAHGGKTFHRNVPPASLRLVPIPFFMKFGFDVGYFLFYSTRRTNLQNSVVPLGAAAVL